MPQLLKSYIFWFDVCSDSLCTNNCVKGGCVIPYLLDSKYHCLSLPCHYAALKHLPRVEGRRDEVVSSSNSQSVSREFEPHQRVLEQETLSSLLRTV